jgi:hypothetical protein
MVSARHFAGGRAAGARVYFLGSARRRKLVQILHRGRAHTNTLLTLLVTCAAQ